MVQVTRLEPCISALADIMNPNSGIRYEVELLWMQPDRSVLDGDGNPVARRPGVIALEFGERG